MFPASFAGVIVCVRMFSVPGWFLDPSVSFAQPFVPMPFPCHSMSMYTLDLSPWFLQPFGLSGRPLAVLPGVSVSFAMLCTSVCTFDMSEWFPQLFGSSECCFVLQLYFQCMLSQRHPTLGVRVLSWSLRSAGGSIAMGLWPRDGCGCT
ncbi:hypothetical protein SCLCIDRAFT_1116534 [Scleroderma citrinum Foug A]|uniref:Uncharacterized protein n=1 Tax=Scleroderma citrinum Foug A TaxID=1036808 RepID=A0A0C2Z787_9AGAM|nr:hypothetical protein SCLCIDRAFT_1116534 [Scleroderma citrinum Foug A]